MVAIEKTLKEGDSFLYTCLETKRTYGFVLITSIPNRGRNPRFHQFALINLPTKDDISLDDFKETGLLYTRMIPNFREGTERLGIHTVDFLKEHLFLLNKFKFIGTLKIDKSKFMIGSGSNPAIPEKFFVMVYKSLDVIMANYDKTHLMTILN